MGVRVDNLRDSPVYKRAMRRIEKIKRRCSSAPIKTIDRKPHGAVYYVYGLFDPRCNKPFYIGKGYKGRAYEHLKDCKNWVITNVAKHQKIKDILNCWLEPDVVFLCSNLSESEAYRIERSIIRYIGLKNLTNAAKGQRSENERVLEELKDDFKRIRPFCRWREKVLWQILPGSGLNASAHEAMYWDMVAEFGQLRATLSGKPWPDYPPIYNHQTRELHFYRRDKNVSA